VLVYHDPARAGEVHTHHSLSVSINDFMRTHAASAYFDPNGRKYPYDLVLRFGNIEETGVAFNRNSVYDSGNDTLFRPRYRSGMIFGWRAVLPAPDEQAPIEFRSAYSVRNLASITTVSNFEEGREISRQRAVAMARDFEQLLGSAEREEDLQAFLKQNPEFIYPDYTNSYPKFNLGGELITDFVFRVQGQGGREHVFVEIERADKPIFTKERIFSAQWTQAFNQLLEWESWVTQEYAFLSKRLPGLYKPRYHLIMGRGKGLTEVHRAKIKDVCMGNKRFSTYDDLLERFKRITSQLL
jgi:hypothetical protein